MPKLLPLLALTFALVLIDQGARPADGAARRDHGRHGVQRSVCAVSPVRRWPGGPSVGTLKRRERFHSYATQGSWTFGVSVEAADGRHRRGYVLTRRFCPPTVRVRLALARARVLAARVLPGRPGKPLARPMVRRICAPEVYVRDRPLNRAIGLLYAGDSFEVRRLARTPNAGGLALGHVRRRGWVPRSALCRDLDARLPGYAPEPARGGLQLLRPPAVVACGSELSGHPLLQAGVRFAPDRRRGRVTVRLAERGGRTAGVPVVLAAGRRPGFQYAPIGPFRCGRDYTVRYYAGAGHTRFAVRIGPRRAAARAVAAGARAVRIGPRRAPARAVAAGALRCWATGPQKRYAHRGSGPVDHRYHARPAISANGLVVAFEALAARQVVVRDSRTGRRFVASARADGTPGNGPSRAPAMSGSGRVVAFESSATNLALGGLPGRAIFVREGSKLRRIGQGRTPAVSADATTLAYESHGEIRVVDLASGASRTTVAGAYRPALSEDGRFLAFETRRAAARDETRSWDVVRLDLRTGEQALVSSGPGGAARPGASLAPSLSADGNRVAFQSEAALTPADRIGLRDVFVRDIARGETTLVSRTPCGRPGNGYSRYPSLSADGNTVAFDSHANDLVPGAPRGRGQVYVHDLSLGRTVAASVRPGGRPSARTSFSPTLAARAAVVAFPAFSYDLGPLDFNRRVDTYVRELDPRRTHRLG